MSSEADDHPSHFVRAEESTRPHTESLDPSGVIPERWRSAPSSGLMRVDSNQTAWAFTDTEAMARGNSSWGWLTDPAAVSEAPILGLLTLAALAGFAVGAGNYFIAGDRSLAMSVVIGVVCGGVLSFAFLNRRGNARLGIDAGGRASRAAPRAVIGQGRTARRGRIVRLTILFGSILLAFVAGLATHSTNVFVAVVAIGVVAALILAALRRG